MALVYGLYFAVRRRTLRASGLFGIVWVFFYLVFMLWQTYYAMLTSRVVVVGHPQRRQDRRPPGGGRMTTPSEGRGSIARPTLCGLLILVSALPFVVVAPRLKAEYDHMNRRE